MPNNPFIESPMKALAPLKWLSNCVIGSLHYQPWPQNPVLIMGGQRWTRPLLYLGLSTTVAIKDKTLNISSCYMCLTAMCSLLIHLFFWPFTYIKVPSLAGLDLKISVLAAALERPYQAARRQHEAFSQRTAACKQRMLSELLPHNVVCYQLHPQMEKTFPRLKCHWKSDDPILSPRNDHAPHLQLPLAPSPARFSPFSKHLVVI